MREFRSKMGDQNIGGGSLASSLPRQRRQSQLDDLDSLLLPRFAALLLARSWSIVNS
jgi:hypothetical protein